MERFHPHKRQLYFTWNIAQMETLIENALQAKSSTYISYAALEGRMAIERIEYEILTAAAKSSLGEDWNAIIGRNNGIQKANQNFKSLKYKYQTFTEVFSEIFTEGYPLKSFDLKKAENYQSKLAQYIHIYTKSPDDFIFESNYISEGIKLIKDVINYLKDLFKIKDGGYIFGVLDYKSLKNGADIVFKNWLTSNRNDDIENLKTELKNCIN